MTRVSSAVLPHQCAAATGKRGTIKITTGIEDRNHCRMYVGFHILIIDQSVYHKFRLNTVYLGLYQWSSVWLHIWVLQLQREVPGSFSNLILQDDIYVSQTSQHTPKSSSYAWLEAQGRHHSLLCSFDSPGVPTINKLFLWFSQTLKKSQMITMPLLRNLTQVF